MRPPPADPWRLLVQALPRAWAAALAPGRALFDRIDLQGHGCFRGVTLAVPVAAVRRLLPPRLDLLPQTLTPPGTHPVVLSFNALARAEMSVPTLLPPLTYHEFTLGVPCCGPAAGEAADAASSGWYYMPQLLLDSLLATMGGVLYWGYRKRLARFRVGPGRFAIDAEDGTPLVSLDHQAVGEPLPVDHWPHFAPVRGLLDQPLVSRLPLALGPWSVVAPFERHWPSATLRPLRTALRLHHDILPGLGQILGTRHPADGLADGLDVNVLGGYELRAAWRLGLPRPPGA